MFRILCSLSVAALMATGAAFADDKKPTPGEKRPVDDKKPADDTKKPTDDPKAEKFTDAMFVSKAASGGMLEVELGKLASEQGKSEFVKSFGAMMVKDHSKANDELMKVAAVAKLDVPPKLMPEHQKMVDKFAALKGEDFDKAYLADMTKDHEMDVKEFTEASKMAKDEGVKGFAAKTLPVVQSHLDMLKKMDKAHGTKDGTIKEKDAK